MRATSVLPNSAEFPERVGSIGLLFYFFAAALIFAVFFMGMPVSQVGLDDRQHRDIFLLVVALLGIIGAAAFPRRTRTREERIIIALAIALPCYALFQLLPLPLPLVAILSPVRAELVRALTPVTGSHTFASISIVPAATFTHFVLQISYCLLFFAAWEFAKRAREKAWVIASPVIIAASVEAIFALVQFFTPGDNIAVRGTYSIRNHFSGLLEMALPFPAMYAIAALRQSPPRGYVDAASAGRIAAGAALAALLASGVLFSLSRGGLAAILVSALVTAAVATNWKMSLRRKLATAFFFCLVAAVALFYLTPMSLVTRLSQHNTAGRVSVWSEGIGIVAQYPLVGCGLGGFESAFLQFKKIEGLILVDYAHNDYLQLFAELGAVGFLIGLVLLGSIARRVVRTTDDTSGVRWVGLACIGSMTAIAVHSAVDFNLYVPANAAIFAWICGLATGLTSPDRSSRQHPFEVESAMANGSASPRRSTPFP